MENFDLRGDILELKMSSKQDINNLKASIIDTIPSSEEKQSDRFRYVYEKMADNHKSTINWLVGTGITIGGLIVAAIKLIPPFF